MKTRSFDLETPVGRCDTFVAWLAIRLAAWFPERISVAASFHPGHLVTDAASPPTGGAHHIAFAGVEFTS